MIKTNKKKIVTVILGICMSMMLVAGCGAADEKAEENTNETVNQTADTTSETSVDTTAEDTASEETVADSTEDTAADTQTADAGDMVAGTYPDGSSPEFSDTRVKLTIDGQEVVIRLYENTAVDAFIERLPLEDLNFSDLSGIEKPVDRPDEAFSLGEETPGYDPVTGDMVIYRPWGNFTIFYGDFRHSDELVPLGQVESGLDLVAGQTEDFTGTMELME